MDCKKVRDMILTDYLDNELEPQQAIEVDRHLKHCSACRAILEAVRQGGILPFKGRREIAPDPVVWQRIQEKIEAERERRTGWLGRLGDILMPVLRAPRLVFSASFVTALIIVVAVFAKWPAGRLDPAYAYIEEQMTVMDGLKSGDPERLNGEDNGYIAGLEE